MRNNAAGNVGQSEVGRETALNPATGLARNFSTAWIQNLMYVPPVQKASHIFKFRVWNQLWLHPMDWHFSPAWRIISDDSFDTNFNVCLCKKISYVFARYPKAMYIVTCSNCMLVPDCYHRQVISKSSWSEISIHPMIPIFRFECSKLLLTL